MTATLPQPTGEAAPQARIRVAIVDDDTVLREGLPLLLPRSEVVTTCRNVPQLLAIAASGQAVDVVLLDLNLNGLRRPGEPHGRRGVEAVSSAGLSVLIYTSERRPAVLAGCFLAGASGIVHKTEPLEQLQAGVEAVHAGRTVVTTAVAGLLDTIARAGRIKGLTQRQAAVLQGRARGETYAAIGRRLFISARTAEEYMRDVIKKLRGLYDGATAAEIERELGLGPGDLME